MSSNHHNPTKLDFVSKCMPGSVAEQKEKERLEEFHRIKALHKAEEQQNEVQLKAEREQKYQADCEANKMRMRRGKTSYPLSNRPPSS